MASSRARRYARALAEVAVQEGRETRVQEDLDSFGAALQASPELVETLMNPAIPFAPKRRITEELAGRLSLVGITVNFILVLLENGRIGEYGEYVEAYTEAMDQRAGVVRGVVTSARGLDSEVRSRLTEVLSELSRARVRLSYEEDESLIGGLRIQVGSVIYDGSIRTQLEEVRRRIGQE
ncbi:MAG: ATP synthase F1 subunit delta [Acidobacteriota bacterium]|nr:ATP synthase F1 subunit delta [Acidobacteriota bacterium]